MDLSKRNVSLWFLLNFVILSSGSINALESNEFMNTTLADSMMHYLYLNRNHNSSEIQTKSAFLYSAIRLRLPGICYTEVPSYMLLCGKAMIRVGDGSKPNLTTIQVCCKGFERNTKEIRRCDPICSAGCLNGEICVAPDLCFCSPYFAKNDVGHCVPTCPMGCENGECSNEDKCNCKSGFQLTANKKFCIPNGTQDNHQSSAATDKQLRAEKSSL